MSVRDDFGDWLSIAYFEKNYSAYACLCGWIVLLKLVEMIALVRLQRVWWPQSKIEGFCALYQSNQTL